MCQPVKIHSTLFCNFELKLDSDVSLHWYFISTDPEKKRKLSSVFQTMAFHKTGGNSLPDPIMTHLFNIDPDNPIYNGISDSSNGLSPDRRHAVVWTNNDPFRRRILRHQASKWKPVTIAIVIIMSEPKHHKDVYKSVLKLLNGCIFYHNLSVSNLMIPFKIICSASCNGLPPNGWQAVAWTSNDPVHRYILRHQSWMC